MGGPLPTASYYGGMRLLLLSMGGRRPYNYLVTGGISLGNPRDPFSMGGDCSFLLSCGSSPRQGWGVLVGGPHAEDGHVS